MKKEERLHRLFGDIDDDLVADAARKPIRKAVWVPAVAAAACVALAVGLWQGGVFDPAPIPVETPDEGASVTEGTTDPTTVTTTTPAEPTDPSKKTEPHKSETTKTEPTKTTATTIDGKTVVFANESSGFIPNSRPNGGYLHGTVKEKMEQYKGQDVLYAVIVEVYYFPNELLENYPEGAPYIWEENEELWYAYTEKYLQPYIDQRVKKLKEITGKELIPISTDDKYFGFYAKEKNSFFMELTAEEINELDKCDCFFIRLRHPDGDAASGIAIPH